MQRKLSDFFDSALAKDIGFIEQIGKSDVAINSLEYDSRSVKEGSLFFALSGIHTDGHHFVDDAISKGACIIVYDSEIKMQKNITYIKVRNTRFAMSPFAAAFYDNPSHKLKVIGVTGTEGKSTTVYLLWQLLRSAGKRAGFISTVQYSTDGTAHWNKEHQTTPEAPVIQSRLFEMFENGLEYAVIESSSHALSPRTNRVGSVRYCAAVMTNVTHEHLEFHGTWEQYRSDKANLFRMLDNVPNSFGIVNFDDSSADYFIKSTNSPVYSFSTLSNSANIYADNIEAFAKGNSYKIISSDESFATKDNLPGSFNVGNVLAALFCTSKLLSIPIKKLALHIAALRPVHGRMTALDCGQNFEVLIDYAHTPSSFSAIFPPLSNRIHKNGGRVITLFGSAGERDTQKRPLQGGIAAAWSDIIVLCDEDPRGEDPMAILEDIACGIKNKTQGENLFLIPDRPSAIQKAFSLAQAGDLVLLLGKGHENSIIYSLDGKATISYDEVECAKAALKSLLS